MNCTLYICSHDEYLNFGVVWRQDAIHLAFIDLYTVEVASLLCSN